MVFGWHTPASPSHKQVTPTRLLHRYPRSRVCLPKTHYASLWHDAAQTSRFLAKFGELLQIDTQIKIKIIKPHTIILYYLGSASIFMSYFIDIPAAADPTGLHSPEAMHVAWGHVPSGPISKKGRKNQAAIGNSYEQLTTSIDLWSFLGIEKSIQYSDTYIYHDISKNCLKTKTVFSGVIRESAATKKNNEIFWATWLPLLR